MRHTTTATLLAVLLLAGAAVGCTSDGDDKPEAQPRATLTATASATPSLSPAETKQQCSTAIAEAAPGWDDWNFDPGAWADDPRTPEVCQGLVNEDDPTQGNRDYMEALLDGLKVADDPRAG
jgi:hypothetical protein